MSALFDFSAFLTVVLLTICTCSYVKYQAPYLLSERTGFRGLFWKAARIEDLPQVLLHLKNKQEVPQAWDPVLIIAQIVSLQCLFYISLGLLLWLLVGPYAMHLTLQHFFDASSVNFHAFGGWMVSLSNIINAFAASLYLMFVVERAKKCLDFAATLYCIHLLAVSLVSGFPWNMSWWLVNAISFVICALLGEWLCVQRELQDIPITSALSARRRAGAQPTSSDMANVQLTAIKV